MKNPQSIFIVFVDGNLLLRFIDGEKGVCRLWLDGEQARAVGKLLEKGADLIADKTLSKEAPPLGVDPEFDRLSNAYSVLDPKLDAYLTMAGNKI
jgi:hypothetical protein